MKTLTVSIFIMCWFVTQLVCAQPPEKILAPMDVKHNSVWLAEQAKALSENPDEIWRYPDYVAYMMMTGEESLLAETCRKWYESGQYSPSLMNYSYNELAGMEKGGIIFTNGESLVYAKLLLQHGKRLFRDKKVICLSFLDCDAYRQTLEKELGIPPFRIKKEEWGRKYKTREDVCDALLKHIIRHTNRPVYFSSTLHEKDYSLLQDSLYSEGLVFRYSGKVYDNMTVTKRNFEQVYLLDYLKETFVPERGGTSAVSLNLNYIPCFRSLLAFYKQEGDERNYAGLYDILRGIVDKALPRGGELKQAYLDCIELKDEKIGNVH